MSGRPPEPRAVSAKIRVMPDAKVRAKKIKLFLFDVDGVLTDGKLFFFPDHHSFIEAKGYHAHDGAGISLTRLAGIKTGLITRRSSDNVAMRGQELKLDYVRQGIQDKLGAFREILKQESMSAAEACFVGDDIIDLPVMWNCGLAIAVANARDEVKRDAHYVTLHAGGDGALRDAIEFILKAQGKWKQVIESYIAGHGPPSQ